MKPFRGTAEAHLLSHLRLREKLFIVGVLLWAIPGCAHPQPAPVAHAPIQSSVPAAPAPHTAAVCLSSCAGAAYADVSPGGDLCRCWAAHNAFHYTFDYPVNEAAAEYQRGRWQEGIRTVRECRAKGWAWEADETGDHLRCVQPTPSPSLLRRTAAPLPVRASGGDLGSGRGLAADLPATTPKGDGCGVLTWHLLPLRFVLGAGLVEHRDHGISVERRVGLEHHNNLVVGGEIGTAEANFERHLLHRFGHRRHARGITQGAFGVKSSSLGRLRWNDWPRFVQRPAWMLWRTPSART